MAYEWCRLYASGPVLIVGNLYREFNIISFSSRTRIKHTHTLTCSYAIRKLRRHTCIKASVDDTTTYTCDTDSGAMVGWPNYLCAPRVLCVRNGWDDESHKTHRQTNTYYTIRNVIQPKRVCRCLIEMPIFITPSARDHLAIVESELECFSSLSLTLTRNCNWNSAKFEKKRFFDWPMAIANSAILKIVRTYSGLSNIRQEKSWTGERERDRARRKLLSIFHVDSHR